MILFQELENLRLSEKYMAMNLKDYRVQPDEGLFEQIEKRLKVRRMVRVGSVVAVVCVVMVGVLVVVLRLTDNEGAAALSALGSLIPYYFLLWILRDRISRQVSFELEES